MIGAIIGDVVGSRFEFCNIKSKDFELITKDSRFTDDTVLTIACIDACCHADGFNKKEIGDYLRKWTLDYMNSGFGSRYLKWALDDDQRYTDSFGNGAAMRITAAGYFGRDEKEVKKLSKILTQVTHNHPESLKAAETVAMCIHYSLIGKTKDEIKRYAISKYPEIQDMDYQELVSNYDFDITCKGSVPQAIYCFLISKDFEDCLRTSISIGGDSDTIAAISCSIAEAYYKQIPEELETKVRELLPQEMLDILEDAKFILNMQ